MYLPSYPYVPALARAFGRQNRGLLSSAVFPALARAFGPSYLPALLRVFEVGHLPALARAFGLARG
jgi:hypothetical protein